MDLFKSKPEESVSESCEKDPDGRYLRQTLSEVEYRLILETLKKTGWIKRKAAKVLGISRSTLYRRLQQYKIH